MAIIVPIETKYNPRGVKTAIRDFDDFKNAVNKAGGGFSGFAKVTSGVLKQVGSNIKDTGQSMTLGVTLPLVGVGIAAFKVGADFEQSMNVLQKTSGASAAAMAKLGATAKQLGADTTFSANEAAQAMLELAKSGFKPAQIAGGGVQASMALAATEGLNLADSAVIVGNAMNTYKIKASKAAKVADILAGASNASSASVASLSQALAQVGPGAVNAGLSLNQTVGVLAAFDNAGIKGSDAGTSLKTMLSRLVPQTDAAAAMMKKLGLNFVDANGNIKPITNAAQQLHDKLGKLSEAERITAMNVMFGSDATRAATVLMNEGKKGLQGYIDATKQLGAAQELSNARMKAAAGAMEQLKGTIETALLALSDALNPIIVSVSAFVKEWVDKFTQLDPSVQKVIVVVGLLAAAIGPLLIVVGMMVSAAGVLIGALGAISLPVLAVIAAIAGVVAVIVLLWNKSQAFRDGVIKVWEAIKAAVASVVDNLKRKLAENQDKIDALKEGFSKFWDFLQTYVIPAVAKFYEVYLSTLIKVIGWVIERVIDFYSGLWDFIAAVIDAGKKVWEFGGKVKDAIGIAVDWISKLPDTVKRLFSDAVTWLLQAGKDIVMGLWNGIRGTWDGFVGWVEEKVDALPDAVKSLLHIGSPSRVFMAIGGDIVAGLRIGVDKAVPSAVESARALATAITSTVQEGGKKLRENLGTAYTDWFQDTVAKLKANVADAKAAMQDFADSTADAISAAMSLSDALSGSLDRSKAIADAEKALAEAQARASAPDATDADRAAVTTSAADLEQARAAGTQLGTTFMDALRAQAAQAVEFANQVKQLIAMGLSEAALQQVLAAGVTAGSQIAAQLIAGGATTINETNKLIASTQAAAVKVGQQAAGTFYGTGVDSAKSTLSGFEEAFGKGGKQRAKLMAIMDRLAEDAKRSVQIDVEVTRNVTEVITRVSGNVDGARAGGGPVSAGGTYLVGEKGPELVTIGNRGGYVTPNDRLGGRSIVIEKGAVQVDARGNPDADSVQAAVEAALEKLVREMEAS